MNGLFIELFKNDFFISMSCSHPIPLSLSEILEHDKTGEKLVRLSMAMNVMWHLTNVQLAAAQSLFRLIQVSLWVVPLSCVVTLFASRMFPLGVGCPSRMGCPLFTCQWP